MSEELKEQVFEELKGYLANVRTVRLGADEELYEWVCGLTEEKLACLPESFSFEIVSGKHHFLFPVSKPQQDAVKLFGSVPEVTISDREPYLETPEDVLRAIVVRSYKEKGYVSTVIANLIAAFSADEMYPIIFEAKVNKRLLIISITDGSKLNIPDEEFNQLYVHARPLEGHPEDTEEGPVTSSDQMFEEVSEAMQEAIQEEIEPPLPERCTMATTETGRYAVEVYREFPNREAALNFMKAQLDL